MTEEGLRNQRQENVFLKKNFSEQKFDENATVPCQNKLNISLLI